MVYDDVLWEFLPEQIRPRGETNLEKMYQFLFTGITDGHVPVYKPVGFAVKTKNGRQKRTLAAAVERSPEALAAPLSIAANLKDFIYLGSLSGNSLEIHCEPGRVAASQAGSCLYTNPCLLVAAKEMVLELFMAENTGYQSVAENYERMAVQRQKEDAIRFFPLHTYHILTPYLRILPFDGKTIRCRYQNGLTPAALELLFLRMAVRYKEKSLTREDMKWVSAFYQ